MSSICSLTSKDKDLLAQRLLDIHQADPSSLRKAVPEIADLLDELQQPSPAQPTGIGLTGLTARERKFHQEEFDKLTDRSKTLTAAEAVKGLEHGANLLSESDFTPKPALREELLKLVRKATGIQPRKKGKPVEQVVGEGIASRIVPVVRGINLHLTWEFKLVKITMNPEQWRLRCQAVSIVGIGYDYEGMSDVAENHDEYFVEATENA